MYLYAGHNRKRALLIRLATDILTIGKAFFLRACEAVGSSSILTSVLAVGNATEEAWIFSCSRRIILVPWLLAGHLWLLPTIPDSWSEIVGCKCWDTADDDMVPAVTATAALILWKNALLSIMLSSASKSASL